MKLKNISSADTQNWRNAEQLIYDVMKLHDFEEVRLSLLQESQMLKKCLKRDFYTDEKDTRNPNVMIDLCLDQNISLRPEGTINLLSNFLNNYDNSKALKYYYLGNMIRIVDNEVEETYRLGAEIYGDETIVSDITVIDTALKLLNAFGFKSTLVEINSFGCEDCILTLPKVLMKDSLDKTQSPEKETRITSNYYQNSLENSNYCPECQARLHKIRHFLSNLMIKYKYNPDLTRTYNYYNAMVFNIYIQQGDENILVGGGGRYDHLTEYVTGRKIPSIGFDLNLDTIYELVKKNNLFPDNSFEFKVFICSEAEDLLLNEMQILQELHKKMIYTIQGKVTPSSHKALELAKEESCSVLIYIDNESLYKGKVEVVNLHKEHGYHVSLDAIIDELEIIKKSIKQQLFI
jgi:histidyl-tRNA synthetase